MHTRGVYLGATRSYSRNPDVSLGEIKDQEQENLGLNGRFYTPVWDQGWLDLGLAVAPYEGAYFIKDAKDSDFSVRGGGLTGNGKLSWLTDRHDITARLAVSLSENSRRSPQHFFNWQNSPSRHWGIENDLAFSRQGGAIELAAELLATLLRRLEIALDRGYDFGFGGGVEERHRLFSC